jgi:hypothetical protein
VYRGFEYLSQRISYPEALEGYRGFVYLSRRILYPEALEGYTEDISLCFDSAQHDTLNDLERSPERILKGFNINSPTCNVGFIKSLILRTLKGFNFLWQNVLLLNHVVVVCEK